MGKEHCPQINTDQESDAAKGGKTKSSCLICVYLCSSALRGGATLRRDMSVGKSACSKSGMTLIEVMLAVLIVSVGMVALLTATSQCLAIMKNAKNYQDVLWTLSTADAEHILYPTNKVEEMAVAPENYGAMTYERVVDDDEDEDGLYVVRTKVSWESRGRKAYEEVLSYIYIKPDESKKKTGGTAAVTVPPK